MITSKFSPETINFLATLGWDAAAFSARDESGTHHIAPVTVRHSTVDSLVARRPSSRSKSQDDASVFVLDYSGTQYPSSGLIIESKTIETGRPQWQKAVMLWYTRAVFTVEQINIIKQNQLAEFETRKRRRDEALRSLLPDTSLSVPDLDATGAVHLSDDGRLVQAILKSYNDWRFPSDATQEQRLRMIAALAKAYRDIGFTH